MDFISRQLLASGEFVAPPGEQVYTTPGIHQWVVPAGVTSVCVVCVGGGSGYNGQLGFQAGDYSYFRDSGTLYAGGGEIPKIAQVSTNTTLGGGYSGTYAQGGGNGGDSQRSGYTGFCSGGSGAGGYSGNGGSSYNYTAQSEAGVGGAGAGGNGGYTFGQSYSSSGGGGGTGIFGQGANGAPSPSGGGGGGGGSGGGSGTNAYATGGTSNGGIPGGGSGSPSSSYCGGAGGGLVWGNNIPVTPGETVYVRVALPTDGYWSSGFIMQGAHGAVRIIWGAGRSFPFNAA